MKREPQLVAIFGPGRNGSTLLMRLLDGSPGLWIYPIELNYFIGTSSKSLKAGLRRVAYGWAPRSFVRRRYRRSFHAWALGQLKDLEATYLSQLEEPCPVTGDPATELIDRTGHDLRSDLPNFLTVMHESYDDRRSSADPLLVFKSIEVQQLERYDTMFPHMKFVHIVRDPLSNYSSLKRTDMVLKGKPFWFQGGDILRMHIESRWLPHVRFLLQRTRDQPDRHYVVRYEDLCASAAASVGGICQWLGVAPPDQPSTQTVLAGRHMKKIPINASQRGVLTPTHVVSNMATEFGYDDVLTERERELIRLRTYDSARELGYFTSEHDSVRPDRFALLRKWVALDDWEYMNASSTARLVRAIARRRLYLCRALLRPPAADSRADRISDAQLENGRR